MGAALTVFLAGAGVTLAFLVICWALFGGGTEEKDDAKLIIRDDEDVDWSS